MARPQRTRNRLVSLSTYTSRQLRSPYALQSLIAERVVDVACTCYCVIGTCIHTLLYGVCVCVVHVCVCVVCCVCFGKKIMHCNLYCGGQLWWELANDIH